MNLLDSKTIMALKEYAKKRGESKIKSPNMAVSGVTGKGDYPVKSAPPDKNKLARGFKVTKEYLEARAKRGPTVEEDRGPEYDMFGNRLI